MLGLVLMPSVDNIMSPEKQGILMKSYIEKGYDPVAYKVYSGLYTYYAGSNVYETKDLDEISSLLTSNDSVVLGIAEKNWRKWQEKPEGMEIIHRQWIAGREYLLIINE